MENNNENLKPITWQDLEDFVKKIPLEYKQKTAMILFQDEEKARELLEPFFMRDDIYINESNRIYAKCHNRRKGGAIKKNLSF